MQRDVSFSRSIHIMLLYGPDCCVVVHIGLVHAQARFFGEGSSFIRRSFIWTAALIQLIQVRDRQVRFQILPQERYGLLLEVFLLFRHVHDLPLALNNLRPVAKLQLLPKALLLLAEFEHLTINNFSGLHEHLLDCAVQVTLKLLRQRARIKDIVCALQSVHCLQRNEVRPLRLQQHAAFFQWFVCQEFK